MKLVNDEGNCLLELDFSSRDSEEKTPINYPVIKSPMHKLI